jgi:hypothetical protein
LVLKVSGLPETFLMCGSVMKISDKIIFLLQVSFLLISTSCSDNKEDQTSSGKIQLQAIRVGSNELNLSDQNKNNDSPIDQFIVLVFNTPLNTGTVSNAIELRDDTGPVSITFSFLDNDKTISIKPDQPLKNNTDYSVNISTQLKGVANQTFPGYATSFKTIIGEIEITSITVGGKNISSTRVTDVPLTLDMKIEFSVPVNTETIDLSSVALVSNGTTPLNFTFSNDNKTLNITSSQKLKQLAKYTVLITDEIKGKNNEVLQTQSKVFYTVKDPVPQMPVISDNELLDLVQKQTLKYFYDFAHPASGMARERNTSGNTVTTGGSGFGIMALIVGIERGFITRDQGIEQLNKIVTFLESADRFHGAWSHWIDGNTGHVIPFGTKDNGGDLVETSFLIQGLLTFRQYLQPADVVDNDLINRITNLYEAVEWDWYRQNDQTVLYWHWSPNYNWDINFALYGYFEEQITYVLAASSPTHSIPKEVYTNGYGRNGAIVTNNTYYGYKLPLGSPAPLFWAQYSYLGLDPHFTDDYADYWEQNVNATLINQAYCIANPKNYVGYSDECWGLTASDNQDGYNAHSPGNDLGVITPTAALSSFPYTPDESMKALKFFYYTLGDRLWGDYGFYDAFNLTEGWTANSYLAIDQGPIVVMIENHRSQLLWNLFMSAPEVQAGQAKLGFH